MTATTETLCPDCGADGFHTCATADRTGWGQAAANILEAMPARLVLKRGGSGNRIHRADCRTLTDHDPGSYSCPYIAEDEARRSASAGIRTCRICKPVDEAVVLASYDDEARWILSDASYAEWRKQGGTADPRKWLSARIQEAPDGPA